jgi:ribosomal protein S18 acetylase RimI-like enzyme
VPVTLASAGPDQFPDVLSFWRAATEVPSSTDDPAGLTALWTRDPEALIVAREDSVIVGTVIAAWDGWRGAFYRLAVHPEHRQRGIGRALVAEGESRLQRRGARRISLFVVEAHAGAVAFWGAVGYHRDHQDVRYVRDLPAPEPT